MKNAIIRVTPWINNKYESTELVDLPPVGLPDGVGEEQLRRELFNVLYLGFADKIPQEEREDEFAHLQVIWDKLYELQKFEELCTTCSGNILQTTSAVSQICDVLRQILAKADVAPEHVLTAGSASASLLTTAIAHEADTAQAAVSLVELLGGITQSDTIKQKQLELSKRFLSSVNFKRFLHMVGRLRAHIDQKMGEKSDTSTIEIVDVETGNESWRVLPNQYFLEDEVFVRKYAAEELLVYDVTPPTTPIDGPFVVLTDCSGSMKGERYEMAQAITFAIAHLAQLQNRTAYGRMFDHHTHNKYSLTNPTEVLQQLSKDARGGTDFDEVLTAAYTDIRNISKADIVLVTDGYAPINESTISIAKKSDARLFVLFVGCPVKGYGLERIWHSAGSVDLVQQGSLLFPVFRMFDEIMQSREKE